MDKADNNDNFLLDNLQVTPSHNQITSGERSLAVQPKVMAVLLYLAKHQHRVISNEELIEHVWQGRVVTHASVQKSINSLRSALGELAGSKEFVVHYSKRGYQLVVPVQFTQNQIGGIAAANPINVKWANIPWRRLMVVAISLAIIAAIWLLNTTVSQKKSGNTAIESLPTIAGNHSKSTYPSQFKTSIAITSGIGHDRSAEPHPDGKQIAYIRDTESKSIINISDASGKVWQLAVSDGRWQNLAWSDSGRNLVAVETRRAEGLPVGLNYYEPANYLYTFHIFTLDFKGKRLLEKNLLSQWQGVVNSVTWWDENTLEFIASQGLNASYERYHYVVPEQRLEVLKALESGFVPVRSTARNGVSAVVSQRKNTQQIEFINADQKPLSAWPLATNNADINWLPNGSGVLVFDAINQRLSTLFLDGELAEIKLPELAIGRLASIRYRKNGKQLVANLIEDKTAIEKISLSAQIDKIAGEFTNGWPVFSPDGKTIVYVSLRNGQYQLWQMDDFKTEHLLATQTQTISNIRWSASGDYLLYQSDNAIWQYSFDNGLQKRLFQAQSKLEPLAINSINNQLWIIKNDNGARNIWRYNIADGTEKQMSFGAVGTALESSGNIYFQYSRQAGLWQLFSGEQTLKQISAHFPEGSLLLKATKAGVYFVTGGPCRESAVQYLDFKNDTITLILERNSTAVKSHDFDPAEGVLQINCSLAESHIVELLP